MRKEIPLCILAVAVSLLTTSCALSGLNNRAATPISGIDDIDLSNTIAAVYTMAPPDSGNKSRYIWLLNDDKTAKVIEVGAMTYGLLEWTDSTLFFADADNDYYIKNGKIKTIPREKENMQNALIPLSDSQFIGAYNRGIVGDLYDEPVLLHGVDSQESQKKSDYVIDALAKCDDKVFSFVNIDRDNELVGKYSGQMVTSIFDGNKLDFDYHLNPLWYFLGINFPLSNVPCRNGKIYTISQHRQEEGEYYSGIFNDSSYIFPDGKDKKNYILKRNNFNNAIYALQIWDTKESRIQNIILNDESGNPINLTEDQMYTLLTDTDALIEDTLYWHAGDSIFATNISNGVTKPVVEGLNNGIISGFDFRFNVIGNKGYVIFAETISRAKPQLKVIDLLSGKIEREMEFDVPESILKSQYLFGFAVNPSHPSTK